MGFDLFDPKTELSGGNLFIGLLVYGSESERHPVGFSQFWVVSEQGFGS